MALIVLGVLIIFTISSTDVTKLVKICISWMRIIECECE